MEKMKLYKGDLASLQSLSGGMAGDKRFYHKFKIGKKRVESIGLNVEIAKHSLKGIDFISQNPSKRAEDFMDAFLNPKIKVIISNIGGFDSHKLIPYLNIDILKNNPKPLLGYSDITSLHLFMYNLGIQTYYGPSVLDGFAENVGMHKITRESVSSVLFSNDDQTLISAHKWTSEFLNWINQSYNNTKRKMIQENYGQIWINFYKNIEGPLIGGCLDTIVQIKNEKFFPKIYHWKNAVIFLETSEQKMKPQQFKKSLELLKDEINVSKALIFGKPKDETFFNEYLEIIRKNVSKPVVFNLNFGHTAPLYTIPYGGTIQLNFETQKIKISK